MNFYHEYKYYKRAARIYLRKWLGQEYVEIGRHPTVEISGVCNLECVFCAYKDKTDGKVVMANDDFINIINQLVNLGHEYLFLTPQTGDVFIDKHFIEKIEFLENHSGIKGYEFITNLISASEATLQRLSQTKKLERMYISLYGSDMEDFHKITGRSKVQYRRLLDNLNYLADHGAGFAGRVSSFIMADYNLRWSPFSAPDEGFHESDLLAVVRRVAENVEGFSWSGNHTDFDSWGGRISKQDVDQLDMGFRLVGPTVPMTGPCGMLYGGAVVLANGEVNACACRAVGRGLIIGDTKTTSLREILSPENPRYKAILEQHGRDDYPDDCQNCKIFTSIYRKPHGRATVTTQQYLADQKARCAQSDNN